MSKKKQDQESTQLNGLVVRKSNELVAGRYKSGILEQKLVAIAITRLQTDQNSLVAVIFPNELKQMLGKEKDRAHIYRDLKKVSKEMTGHVVQLEDGSGNFKTFSMITNADYENGVFRLVFNNVMADHIFNLKSRFTSYSLAQSLSIKSPYTFRIFELLEKDAYKITDDNPFVVQQYGIQELKFQIGVLDISDKGAQAVQNAGGSWDEMATACKEQRMKSWGNFKTRVIDRAKKELDEISDITFDYNLIKAGHGGKIVAIEFIIHRNATLGKEMEQKTLSKKQLVEKKNEEYKQMDMDQFLSVPSVLHTYIGHNNLSEDDLRNIFHAAGDNSEVAIKAIEMADEASEKTPISNYVGWIISCIRNDYKEPQMVSDGSADRGDRIQKARKQRDDMDQAAEEDMLARYWNSAKKGNTARFQNFVRYLNDNQLDIDMFEAIHNESECGDLFIRWVKKEKISLM